MPNFINLKNTIIELKDNPNWLIFKNGIRRIFKWNEEKEKLYNLYDYKINDITIYRIIRFSTE